MKMELQAKLHNLKENIRRRDSIAVAYSGGVDSTFLLKVAHDVLKEKAIAVTAKSSIVPERELREANSFAQALGIRHVLIELDELAIEGFADNPINRCYLCKREVFSRIIKVAKQNKIKYIADGSNMDDLSDYRPGRRAIEELGVVCPLQEAAMTKNDIRILSKQMNLPTWNKAAFACLATRFPYGEKITKEKLGVVDRLEQYLLDKGFQQVRVRHHVDIARIEVAANERSKFFDTGLLDRIYEKFRENGFTYVTLDIKGYRTGSMNKVIKPENNSRV